jgi:hypothetical protein
MHARARRARVKISTRIFGLLWYTFLFCAVTAFDDSIQGRKSDIHFTTLYMADLGTQAEHRSGTAGRRIMLYCLK